MTPRSLRKGGTVGRRVLNVLLIEDCSEYAYLIEHWLSNTFASVEFRLQWLSTLAAGIGRLAEGEVDAVLLDLGLPDSQGLETYARVRACARQTPIVVLGSADLDLGTLGAIRKSAAGYLIKSASGAETLMRALSNASRSGPTVAIAVPAELPRELVTEYLDDCGNTLIELREAVLKHDYERARTYGHGMKGTGSPYGFPTLTQIGAAIEQAAALQGASELKRQIDRLGDYLERVELV